MMTSNLASDEIASHGLQLRREAEEAAREYRKTDNGVHLIGHLVPRLLCVSHTGEPGSFTHVI